MGIDIRLSSEVGDQGPPALGKAGVAGELRRVVFDREIPRALSSLSYE